MYFFYIKGQRLTLFMKVLHYELMIYLTLIVVFNNSYLSSDLFWMICRATFIYILYNTGFAYNVLRVCVIHFNKLYAQMRTSKGDNIIISISPN